MTLIHGSFPCTDTSLAGARQGIYEGESAAFWEFARILKEMGERRPPLVMIENVEGLLTSNDGRDIEAVLGSLCTLGYAVDLLLVDASYFVPQSRVRLFILGKLQEEGQDALMQDLVLQQSNGVRPEKLQRVIRANRHLLWNIRKMPALPSRNAHLADIVDHSAPWWPVDRSEYLFGQMFERHKNRIRDMMARDEWSYGTVFRRTRMRKGKRRSTAELRTDGIAGCLRTPKGGSARQILVRAGYGRFNARLINGRECARLMGAPDYSLRDDMPLNQILFGFGDAVCASVVEWIAAEYFEPLLDELEGDIVHG